MFVVPSTELDRCSKWFRHSRVTDWSKQEKYGDPLESKAMNTTASLEQWSKSNRRELNAGSSPECVIIKMT